MPAAERLQLWQTAMTLGISHGAYCRLLSLGAPAALYELLKQVNEISRELAQQGQQAAAMPQREPLDFVEYFCGKAAHTRAFQEAGYAACGYDCLRDCAAFMDLTDMNGFIVALCLALRLNPDHRSLMWFGTVKAIISSLGQVNPMSYSA